MVRTRNEHTRMALLETLEVHVFDRHDGRRPDKAILDCEQKETTDAAPTSHPAVQLKDYPIPSRGVLPIINDPNKK